jgi:hypothetical protein
VSGLKKAFVGVLAAVALSVPAGTAFSAPPPCDPGDPGCKTVDDPSKNNPKFTETQRGNVDAPGTESTCEAREPRPDQAGLPLSTSALHGRRVPPGARRPPGLGASPSTR